MKTRGHSVAVILLGAAVVGIVAGIALAVSQMPDESMPLASDEVLPPSIEDEATPSPARDPMEADAETLEGIAPYPQASARKLSSRSAVTGMPMKVAWFSTPDSPARVLAFYEKAFAQDDRVVVSHRFSESFGYVGWVDSSREALHLISVIAQSEGTLVLVSKSSPQALLEKPTVLPNGVVLPPSADAPQVIELGEVSLERRTIYTRAREWSVAQTAKFYVEALGKSGWSVSQDGDDVVAKKDARAQVIALGQQGVDTRILITEMTR